VAWQKPATISATQDARRTIRTTRRRPLFIARRDPMNPERLGNDQKNFAPVAPLPSLRLKNCWSSRGNTQKDLNRKSRKETPKDALSGWRGFG
jgi:hypothetical protein